jgi:hypothetical protein
VARKWLATRPLTFLAVLCSFYVNLKGAYGAPVNADDSTITCATPIVMGISPVAMAVTPVNSLHHNPGGAPINPPAGASFSVPARIVVEQPQLDLTRFSSDDTAMVTIGNQTSTPITEIRLSSTEMVDGKTHRRMSPLHGIGRLSTPLQPNEQTDCTFSLKQTEYGRLYT